MKFDRRCKIEGVTSNETVRYALGFVHVNPKGFLEASNGKALAVVPVFPEDGEKVVDTLLEPGTMAFACKIPKGLEPSIEILADGSIRNKLGETRPGFKKVEGENLHYPDVEAVTPDPGDRPPDLVIDPYLLLRVAEAVGVDRPVKDGNRIPKAGLALWFGIKEGKIDLRNGIYVRPLTDTGAWGVIMPFTHDAGVHVRTHHPRKKAEASK
jgi:hypothetical protein